MPLRARSSSLFFLCLVPAALGCSVPSSSNDNLTSTSLVEWVDAHAADIPSVEVVKDDPAFARALEGAIDDEVAIVGVGESAHGTREFNQLRVKMFQYLVEVHGFRAIVPETGLIEARLVDQYVLGADIPLEEVMTKGFTHNMGLDRDAQALVEWMREYNAGKEPSDQVHFAGKDQSLLGDTVTVPLEPLAAYLATVDPDYAASPSFTETMELARAASDVPLKVDAAFRAQGALAIEADLLDAFTTIGFEQLSTADQQRLETGVQAIVDHMAANADSYEAASSADDYQWNAQLAVVATQLIRDLRSRQEHPKIYLYEKAVEMLAAAAPEVIVDTRPASDPLSHSMDYTNEEHLRDYFLGRDARELALAENVGWVVNRYGRVMNFAHNSHLFKAPLDVAVAFGVAVDNPGSAEGNYLARDFGARYVLFGGTNIGFIDEQGRPSGEFHGAPVTPTSDAPESFEYEIESVSQAHPVAFFVDFAHGDLPKDIVARLGKRQMRWQVDFQEVDVLENYDGLFVFTSVGPGLPLETAP